MIASETEGLEIIGIAPTALAGFDHFAALVKWCSGELPDSLQ
ncbi:MAG: hypothetical protein PHO08_01465 [Methylococcales bacterium]|nr:hypothetical protein [Methylococcales bacterium]